MNELNRKLISEVLIIFGSVNLGIAWSDTNLLSSPFPFISGILTLFIGIILRER